MICPLDETLISKKFIHSTSRLILLDYDGTLVPFNETPQETRPPHRVLSVLYSLGMNSRNKVVLISGRDMKYLEFYFEQMPVTLVAEHGGFCKDPGMAWTAINETTNGTDWIMEAGKALQALTFQYEGSFVEWKEFSVTWHYRALKDRLSSDDKEQIITALKRLRNAAHFVVTDNHFTLELRTPGVSKDAYLRKYCSHMNVTPFDFIMAMGDSLTDEDLFRHLGPDSFTIKVGPDHESNAHYFIESQSAVLPLLEGLSKLEKYRSLNIA